MDPAVTALIPFAGLLSLPAAFFSIRLMSGWNQLEQKYKCDDTSVDNWNNWGWGMIGICSFKGCFATAITAQGLHLKVQPVFLFGFVCPHLLIPWSAVKSVSDKTYLFKAVTEITLYDFDKPIKLDRGKLAEAARYLESKMASPADKKKL